MAKLLKVEDGEDGDNDSLSKVPSNVIDLIMKLLPVRDAAKTCVLSSKWRNVWANLPYLVLGKKFWDDIKLKSFRQPNVDYAGIVNKILLRHTGKLQKFVVDISIINSERHCDINLWLVVVCGRGVEELSILNSPPNAYTIPSCVFYAPELTNLSISNCIIKTKDISNGFSKLQTLTLNDMTLNSCILETPLLTTLRLQYCLGVCGFSISAPKLMSLTLNANKDFNLIPYLLCKNITFAYINLSNIQVPGDVDTLDLVKLFNSWPNLANLIMDGSSLKYLTTGLELDDFSSELKLTRFVPFSIDLNQAAWVLRIIGNSPFLKIFEFWFPRMSSQKVLNSLEELKCLEEQSIMDISMEQLRTVKIRYFRGHKSELQFVKTLLHCSPSLKLMLVEELTEVSFPERLKVSKELMCFQRAYAKTEIIFGPFF